MKYFSKSLLQEVFGYQADGGSASKETLVFVARLRLFVGTLFIYGPTVMVWYGEKAFVGTFRIASQFEVFRDAWTVTLAVLYVGMLSILLLRRWDRGQVSYRVLYTLSLLTVVCDFTLQALISHCSGILVSQFPVMAIAAIFILRVILDYWHALVALVLGVLF